MQSENSDPVGGGERRVAVTKFLFISVDYWVKLIYDKHHFIFTSPLKEIIPFMKTENRNLYAFAAIGMFLLAALYHLFLLLEIGPLVSPFQPLVETPHLLIPQPLTFSLWTFVFAWLLVSHFLGFYHQTHDTLKGTYKLLVAPRYVEIYLYHIGYLLLWTNGSFLFALILILLYIRRLIDLVKIISANPALRQQPWLLKYPVGLHAGWVSVITGATFYTYLADLGLQPDSPWMIVGAVATLLGFILYLAYHYAKYGNQFLMLPMTLFLIGLALHHYPNSNFYLQNTVFFIALSLLIILQLVLYTRILYLHAKQTKEKNE